MNINEVSTRLDMKARIVITQHIDTFQWSRTHNVSMSVFFEDNPDKHYFRAFISKKFHKNIENIIPEYFDAIEKDDYLIITRMILNDNIYNLMNEIRNIPSAILHETTIERGQFIVRLRYNSDYRLNISETLNKYLVIPNFIHDILITQSEGIKELMSNKNERMPLSVFKYNIPLYVHNMSDIEKILGKMNFVGEIVDSDLNKDYFKALIYLNEKIMENENLKCISDKNNIYETHIKNDLLSKVRIKANDHGIFREGTYFSIKDDLVYLTMVIASHRIMEYIKILISETIEQYGKNIVTIKTCSDYSPSFLDTP